MSARESTEPAVFLTAEWQYLVMLNYEMDSDALAPSVPAGTELDLWKGKSYVSIVGFLFRNVRIAGIQIPFHRHFEEVNLRFYVRRKVDGGWRRGVVFIKELVPRRAVAFIARKFYNENYSALPMSHRIDRYQGQIRSVSYSWRSRGRDDFVHVTVGGQARPAVPDSLEEFITEHYWGYAVQRDGSTKEYLVEHPRWNVWETERAEFHCDVAGPYGKEFCSFFDRPPSSAFLADGSDVKIYKGIKLTP